MRPRCAASVALASFVSINAFAQQPTSPVSATLQRIETARQSVHTLEAQFDEERVMGLFAQTLHADGRLLVQGNCVRWEIVGANAGVFVVDGQRVAYRAGGSSATANQSQIGALGAVLGDLAAFLGGSLQGLASRYTFASQPTPTGGVTLTAAPLDAAVRANVDHVAITFAANLQTIEAIEIVEPGGDHTRISVHGTQINSGHVAPNACRI